MSETVKNKFANIGKEDVKYYSIDEAPFKVYGIYRDGDKYRRLPEAVAATVNDGALRLHANTAGGRIRFKTNSPYVAIHAEYGKLYKADHFTLCGSIGFDLYVDNRYAGTFRPDFGITEVMDRVLGCGSGEKEILIHFPLYSEVKSVYIGLAETAEIHEPAPYINEKPVVYYGSSITQGGCASRPGMCYENIISRRLNIDHVNLVFSGSAKGEDTIVEYIAGLPMSVFVMDYDHNAPTVEHLRDTHEKMFKAIRTAQPDLPVIMMSRPQYRLSAGEVERRHIVETTYLNAVAAGDKNVYFLDGEALTRSCLDEGTVDNTHPTDFGFASMADAVCEVLEKIKF